MVQNSELEIIALSNGVGDPNPPQCQGGNCGCPNYDHTFTLLQPVRTKTDDVLSRLTPMPQHWATKQDGGRIAVRCGAGWKIAADDAPAASVSATLQAAIARGYGCTLPVVSKAAGGNGTRQVILTTDPKCWSELPPEHHKEGYVLEVDASLESVALAAPTELGLFHAAQTLQQMLGIVPSVPTLAAGKGCIPNCELPSGRIIDYPDLPWRGFYMW